MSHAHPSFPARRVSFQRLSVLLSSPLCLPAYLVRDKKDRGKAASPTTLPGGGLPEDSGPDLATFPPKGCRATPPGSALAQSHCPGAVLRVRVAMDTSSVSQGTAGLRPHQVLSLGLPRLTLGPAAKVCGRDMQASQDPRGKQTPAPACGARALFKGLYPTSSHWCLGSKQVKFKS